MAAADTTGSGGKVLRIEHHQERRCFRRVWHRRIKLAGPTAGAGGERSLAGDTAGPGGGTRCQLTPPVLLVAAGG